MAARRIQTAIPEIEKAQRNKEKLGTYRPRQKALRLAPEAAEQIEYFCAHPEIFADAVSQLKVIAEGVRILPVPDGEQL